MATYIPPPCNIQSPDSRLSLLDAARMRAMSSVTCLPRDSRTLQQVMALHAFELGVDAMFTDGYSKRRALRRSPG